jgi:hypothetical protein
LLEAEAVIEFAFEIGSHRGRTNVPLETQATKIINMNSLENVADDEGEQLEHPKYQIYSPTHSNRINNIHIAAQFGDKKFIMAFLEKTLDADVNATVSNADALQNQRDSLILSKECLATAG